MSEPRGYDLFSTNEVDEQTRVNQGDFRVRPQRVKQGVKSPYVEGVVTRPKDSGVAAPVGILDSETLKNLPSLQEVFAPATSESSTTSTQNSESTSETSGTTEPQSTPESPEVETQETSSETAPSETSSGDLPL